MKTKLLQALSAAAVLMSAAPAPTPRFLFVWAGDADRKASDFIAVLDVTPHYPSYGRVIASVAARAAATTPHHTEYSLPESGFLFANGYKSGKSFIFDVRDPL